MAKTTNRTGWTYGVIETGEGGHQWLNVLGSYHHRPTLHTTKTAAAQELTSSGMTTKCPNTKFAVAHVEERGQTSFLVTATS